MKKFTLLIVAVVIAIITYSIPNFVGKSEIKGDMQVTYYTNSNISKNSVLLYGNTYMTTFNGKEYKEIESSLNNILSVSAQFQGDYNDFKKTQKKCGVNVLNSQTVDDVLIIYGYSDKFGRCVQVLDKMVNIQIAIRKNTITVGTPLIMGSY